MSDSNNIVEINRELARKINEEARANPQSPYANKWVGIANGFGRQRRCVPSPAAVGAGPTELLYRRGEPGLQHR